VTSSSPGSELRRLRALVGDLDAVVWEAEAASGRFRFVSEGAREILGFPPSAFLEEPSFWADHIHPDDRETALKEFFAGIEEGRPHDIEYRFRQPGGSVVWVRDIGHVVTDTDDRPLVVRGLMVDITQQKLAEERRAEVEQRHRRLVEQLPAVVYLESVQPQGDRPGRPLYVSPQVERILGFTVEEWLDDPAGWVGRVHPDDAAGMRDSQGRLLRTGEVFRADYRMLAKGGQIVWIHDEATLVRDEDGAPLYWQGVLFDTSAEARTEQLELALEAEREEAAELRALDEMKNTFLTAVSHDLRTPLAAILGLAVTLEHQELEEGEARDLASRIAANARKLDRMVTDLLDLDRLSRGIVEPDLRPVDVGSVVARVVDESDIVIGRDVHVETESVLARLDETKIERIVENLLANAVRHTPPEARIWVSTRRDAGGALIAVEDEGPGVPVEQRREIFQPFRQAATPDHSPGVGIGLALVARFAELHGGHAWVQDREGGGASFRVWLPAPRRSTAFGA
jgi:PAS domain S-box-containing protein